MPIHVGLPGPVAAGRLLWFSARIGLGDSARFLRRHGNWLGRLVLPRGYRPDSLLDRLAPHLARADNGVAGLHLFTFNEIERTEQWRTDAIMRLGASAT